MSLLTSAATVQCLGARNRISQKSLRALTLLEILIVCAVLGILAVIYLPAVLAPPISRSVRIQCVNNLKQVALAAMVWSGDNSGKFPAQVPGTNGGSMDFVTGTNAWRHFQVMSNELSTPKVMICPADDRSPATNFTWINNSNLSFFVGIDATETNPAAMLSGDRNLTNGTTVKNGLLNLITNRPSGWTAEIHNNHGNIALADGSVQQLSITTLRATVANTGFATNRLQMPVLTP
jgi:prepilin-type N-terminal cleavage/methylation domain-containing protein/prepilin-type processing-associated H-X9-DG protein